MWLGPSTKGLYKHYFQRVMDVFTCNGDNSFTRILAYLEASTDDFFKKQDRYTTHSKLQPKLNVLSNLVCTWLTLGGNKSLEKPRRGAISTEY